MSLYRLRDKERNTLPETNISPENQWLEDDISIWDGLFSGAMLVSGSVRDPVEGHLF